jgi:arylsulfatase A-like enzyme
MLAVDEMVASLVSELEAAGVLDNTFIFFTSDNGWMQGEHLAKKRESPSHTKSPFACPSSCGVLECPPDRR